jgi:polyisoprenoid-binding protein YceI
MNKHFFTLALALTLGQAQAATFTTINPAQSSVRFSYKQMGVAMDGQFKKFNAQLNFDPAKSTKASGRLDIELASIDTGSVEADDEVVGKAWFNTAAHPKASFVLQSLKPTGPNQYEATGQLTIKGQTRELRAPLKLTPPSTLAGNFVLKRADFGIGEGMWAKFDVVANEITVNFNLNLK